jgi:dipeptidyl aminopeptidase/acylaminoacyl peptidase
VASGEKKKIYDGDAVQPVWSPSGKRIAFWAADAGQRDVRTLPAEGGAFVPVTQDAPADWDPFWSPDGRWLYFLSDRRGGSDLWRIAIDEASGEVQGEAEPVTTGVTRPMQGTISADGRRIALAVDTSRGELLRTGFDPVAGKAVGSPNLLYASARPFTQISLSRDSAWLAYRTTAPRENIYVMRADGTGRRRLTDDAFRNRGPQWVGDDGWVLFYSNRGGDYKMWIVRRDGTDLKELASESEFRMNVPSVSRDGKRLAFMLQPKSGARLVGVTTIDPAWFGPGAPKLTFEVEEAAGAMYAYGWSPDATRFAGQQIATQGGASAVYAPDSDRLEPLKDREGRPLDIWGGGAVWLPDGRRVLSWDEQRNGAVLWDTVSRELRDVPGLPGPSEMELSADGRTLFLSRSVAEGDIWMLTLE